MKAGLLSAAVLCALGVLLCGGKAAQAAEPAPIESTVVAKTGSEPPEPGDGSSDWIQLTSGEWLKGRLHSMRQNRIDFDSEKLDQLTLKWKDVRAVYTAHSMAVMQQNNAVVTGPIRTVDGQLAMDNGVRIDHDAVISIARSAERETDRWFGNVAVGFNLRDGNVDQRETGWRPLHLQRGKNVDLARLQSGPGSCYR